MDFLTQCMYSSYSLHFCIIVVYSSSFHLFVAGLPTEVITTSVLDRSLANEIVIYNCQFRPFGRMGPLGSLPLVSS